MSGIVTVRYFAAAKAALGRGSQEFEVTSPLVVAELIERALSGTQGARAVLERCSFLIDGAAITDRSFLVGPGARVDVLPPFAGG